MPNSLNFLNTTDYKCKHNKNSQTGILALNPLLCNR